MGYTTDFEGDLTITPALAPAHQVLLRELARTRRMNRDVSVLPPAPSWVNGGNWGEQGEFYTAVLAEMARADITPEQYLLGEEVYKDLMAKFDHNKGHQDELGVSNHNGPHVNQPDLWLQWVPKDASTLAWDQCEKFYHYVDWLCYLISRIFQPNGYTLNGTIEYFGEDPGNHGRINVEDNSVDVEYLDPWEEEEESEEEVRLVEEIEI